MNRSELFMGKLRGLHGDRRTVVEQGTMWRCTSCNMIFITKSVGGTTQIAKDQKSELTKNGKTIGVRLTPSEYAEYERLGKSKWLRKELSNKIKERQDGQTLQRNKG